MRLLLAILLASLVSCRSDIPEGDQYKKVREQFFVGVFTDSQMNNYAVQNLALKIVEECNTTKFIPLYAPECFKEPTLDGKVYITCSEFYRCK